MQKYFFVLIPFIILNAKSINNTHKIHKTTRTEQITISKELIDPVVHTDVVLCIDQESHAKKVSLKVYNCLGQVVSVLIDAKMEPGIYSLTWDGRDGLGRRLASGIYFVKYSTDEYTKIKKVVRIR